MSGVALEQDDDLTHYMKAVSRLKAEIGRAPEGSHPDEQRPRAATWHEERLNWQTEVERLREHNQKLQDALLWCSGSQDFAPEGKAREGWQRICAPLLTKITGPLSAGE